jgi:hypothetical protein
VFRVYATLLRPNSHSRKKCSNGRAIKRVKIKENGTETEMLRTQEETLCKKMKVKKIMQNTIVSFVMKLFHRAG